MKYLIFALITFATIAAGILFYGYTLSPVRSGTSSNECLAPARVLLSTILDVESQPSWRKNITSVRRTGDASVWVEKTVQGNETTFNLEVANQKIVSMTFFSNQGYYGKWRADIIENSETQSMITATEEVTVKSPLGRVLSRLLFNPEEFAATYLKELCSEAEKRAAKSN